MNSYAKLKEEQQKRFNAFPMMFAFSDKQFAEGMEKLGLKATDIDKVYKFGNTGGFYKKTDAPALHQMMDDLDRELKEAIAADQTGDGFICEMFRYELDNHEYSYTGDDTDAVDALGLTYEEIAADPRLLHGFKKAKREAMRGAE